MSVELLNELAKKYGTDKGSSDARGCKAKNYMRQYGELFTPIREAVTGVLEIGVAEGASLKTWLDFFPNATISGIDIKLTCRDMNLGKRVEIFIGSQADRAFLDTFRAFEYDIIIDDGSHIGSDQIESLLYLFPQVKSGGFYCIEDLHTAYNRSNMHPNPSILEVLFAGVNNMNKGTGHRVEWVRFSKGLCIIKKG